MLARSSRNRQSIRSLHGLRADWRIEQEEWALAVESLHEAIRMTREAGRSDTRLEARLTLARLRLGLLRDAADEAARLSRRPDPAHLAMAELWHVIGDAERATEHALTGYRCTSAEERTARKLIRLFLRRHRAVSAAIAAALVLLAALSIAFTVRVTGERNRAERALVDLRKTAPTFAAQAQLLVRNQQFEPAIEKLEFAIAIDPASPVYRLQRADLLQASLRLQEAADEYRRVLAIGPNEHAQTNLALTEKILNGAGGEDPPDPQLLHPLWQAMRDQHRDSEAVPLGARLGLGAETALPAINAALAEYRKMVEWNIVPSWMMNYRSRINREPDGTFALYLGGMPIQDLAPLARLRGLPISILDLNGSLVSDLTPIAGLPLRELTATGAPIADLAPLRGMKLRKLVLRRANITSLEPLRGMPLEHLGLPQCVELKSFEALAGLPLRTLNISQTKISDWSPLAGLPLEHLIATGSVVDNLRPLHAMPLEELDLKECGKLGVAGRTGGEATEVAQHRPDQGARPFAAARDAAARSHHQ